MRTLRLTCTGQPDTRLTQPDTRAPAAVWDANDLRVDWWLSRGDACACEAYDISTIAEVSLQIRASAAAVDLLAPEKILTGAELTECTLSAWKAGTGQHGSFILSAADMTMPAGLETVWLSIQARLVTAELKELTAGPVYVIRHGHTFASQAAYFRMVFNAVDPLGNFVFTADNMILRVPAVAGPSVVRSINQGPYLRLLSAGPDDQGLYSFTAGGMVFRLELGFPGEGVAPVLTPGSQLRLESQTLDDYGRLPCSLGADEVRIAYQS